MPLTESRLVFEPFEYPKAYEYWEIQQQAHWLHSEVIMSRDIHDWKFNLDENSKNIIGSTLKGFTQMEVAVNDYWMNKVGHWFKIPEISMMASAFANMESIHAKAYAYLNDSLGLQDYEAFLREPAAMSKIDNLVDVDCNNISEMALSLAVFSAFGEGVQLFSSFAILLSFSTKNLLKGVGEIISFSVRDESLHSEAGCWLFRTLIKENPELFTDEMKDQILEAARVAVKLEDDFIDMVFANGTSLQIIDEGKLVEITPKDIKNYIRYRANTKLGDLGLGKNWKSITDESIKNMAWFDKLTVGQQYQDFFAGRVSDYSKGSVDWGLVFQEGE